MTVSIEYKINKETYPQIKNSIKCTYLKGISSFINDLEIFHTKKQGKTAPLTDDCITIWIAGELTPLNKLKIMSLITD